MIGELAGGLFQLGKLIADEVARKTGADKAVTYEAVMEVLKPYVDAERKAVTDARAKAVQRARK